MKMEDKILNNRHEFNKDSRLNLLKIIYVLKSIIQKKQKIEKDKRLNDQKEGQIGMPEISEKT
jgi:hypothetical protein